MGTRKDRTTNMTPAAAARLLERRDFLRDAGLGRGGVLVALGAMPSGASAAPLEFITALGGGREDKSYPMPAADGTQIDKGNDAIITRWQGKVYVFSLACPHQNTALKWYEKEQPVRVSEASLAIQRRRHLHQGQRASDARSGSLRGAKGRQQHRRESGQGVSGGRKRGGVEGGFVTA